MTHKKDLIKKGYKPLSLRGTKIQMQKLGEQKKKEGKISTYIISKCMDGKWEVYGK